MRYYILFFFIVKHGIEVVEGTGLPQRSYRFYVKKYYHFLR